MGPDGKTLPVFEGLPNAHMRLFGGAQYHRAMAEFRTGIGQLICQDISREEIVNACGIDDFHDGVNYTRTACVIAVSKARDMFEPFLHQVCCCPSTPSAALHVQSYLSKDFYIVQAGDHASSRQPCICLTQCLHTLCWGGRPDNAVGC